jgi:coniferyl-aldehyde dehydrogenase
VDKIGGFVEAAKSAVGQMFPTIRDNPDYTAVVADRHYERLTDYVDDARAKGAEIVEINPAGEDLRQQPHRRMAPTLILNPTDDMKVMQEEIFGPLLPVKAYQKVDEAIDYVNAHARPLGLYYFGSDNDERDNVLDRTTSGGVSVNDVVMHVVQEELPFGGIGPAGMGAYHGHDGFREFSHRKSVFHQMKNDFGLRMLRPPYGTAITKYLASQIKR